MEKQKIHTLVDLKDICVKYITEFDHTQKKYVESKTNGYYFAYPAINYLKYFKMNQNANSSANELIKIDKTNVDITFNHIFNFDTKLAPLRQRSEAMSGTELGIKTLNDKYDHSQYFYTIISEFYLKMLTGLKHKNLYKIKNDLPMDNRNINQFFGFEGKSKFTTEECIEHSLKICDFITEEIDKVIDILYKKYFDDAIDDAIIGNHEKKNEIKNKLKHKLDNN